ADLAIWKSVGCPTDAVPSLFPESGPGMFEINVNCGLADAGFAIASWYTRPVALRDRPMLPLPYVHTAPKPPTPRTPGNVVICGGVAARSIRTAAPALSTDQKKPDAHVTSAMAGCVGSV